MQMCVVADHAQLVRRIAWQMTSRLPSSVDVDDLIQVGMIGLWRAAPRFDAARGVQFLTFATQRIRGAMLTELRDRDWLGWRARDKAQRIEAATHRLAHLLGRLPRESEVAAEIGVGLAAYQAQRAMASQAVVSLEDIRCDVADIADPASLLEAKQAVLMRRKPTRRRTAPVAASQGRRGRGNRTASWDYAGMGWQG